MTKRFVAAAIAVVAAVALSACSARHAAPASAGSVGTIPKGAVIGVALPAKTSQNWVLAGQDFADSIRRAGYRPDVQYANANSPVPDQQSELSAMITKGDRVLIIGAADGSQLGSQLAAAKQAGILVIAWDRLITNTPDVDYYVAFNNFHVGELQGRALLDGLRKEKGRPPYDVELFAGSPDDSNAKIFFSGAMSVLRPRIADGTLRVVSGQLDFQEVDTQGWLAQNAQARMTNLLTAHYAHAGLDGVLAPNDTLARAILTATRAAGKPNPVVTGQDSETASIPLIMDGTQYSTIYKDTALEAQSAVDVVTTLATGRRPTTVDDPKQNDNGVRVVPAVELTPVLVTRDDAVRAYAHDPVLEALAKQG